MKGPVDKETRIKRASSDLEQHQSLMIEIWGTNYKNHPAYHDSVREVAGGRMPFYALCDRFGM
jgi:hypothetical protein